ncbi:hypothetical protein LTR37_001151 [Vermiconidia calcicola]|uniref:Uncharacterized protein n=1 Tax=Vermiconidia calcicola TaxID=1690605 RepID=A0ACC3NWU0_9PEZI|nr:hypothetical protein LTR37_001151 [Vermiconidia calcicola]
MLPTLAGQKRRAPAESDEYDYDEIVVVTKERECSRPALREIHQNKRQRHLDCVLVPKAQSMPATAPTHPVSHPVRSIHTAAASADAPDTASSKPARPPCSTSRPSYALEPILIDSSEDELASKAPKAKKRAVAPKKQTSPADADADAYSGSSSSTDSDTAGSAPESSDSDTAGSAPNSSDSEIAAPKNAKGGRAVSRGPRAAEKELEPEMAEEDEKPTNKRMTKLTGRAKGAPKGLDGTLPPLSDIRDIFADITTNALDLGLREALQHLQGHPVRIATMCSGTESPVLALQMVQDTLKDSWSLDLGLQHVYSAEIEPFKQAYIERNFSPPLLFRDITEFVEAIKQDVPMATTAYGGEAVIPSEIDILVVGTSCVDLSKLNKNKKKLKDGGESGATWEAVVAVCNPPKRSNRPKIVLLENVVGEAPWDKMLEQYENMDYEVAGVLVDSKNYYLPQTRQRGYMVCFDKTQIAAADVKAPGEAWKSGMAAFQRHASSPVSSFLLANDQIVPRPNVRLDDPKTEIDWSKCEITQAKYRLEKRLGTARPVTHWQESGSMIPPEHGSASWFHNRPEREKDTIDVCLLRRAIDGNYDNRYKTRIIDISQNVYRSQDVAASGITGCITPSGKPYITDAARALHPKENLRLQGIPLEKISLTTETPNELQSLAGNAMTTTVVGSALLSALIAGYRVIGVNGHSQAPLKSSIVAQKTKIGLSAKEAIAIVSEEEEVDIESLLANAGRAARRCYCEQGVGLTHNDIQRCTDCGHTTCVSCGGNPEHTYQQKQSLSKSRITPQRFEEDLRSKLPLRMNPPSTEHIQSVAVEGEGNHDLVAAYIESVQAATDDILGLADFRRTNCWTIAWRSKRGLGRLELVLTEKHAEWRFYVDAPKELATNDPLREALGQPVAKAVVTESLFQVRWKWRRPIPKQLQAHIKAHGDRIPTFWSRHRMPDYTYHKQPSGLTLLVERGAHSKLECDIEGTYVCLPRCGTAFDSLYKRTESGTSQPPLYLFLDQTRTKPSAEDPFVVSEVPERMEYDEVRPEVARIDASWRPWAIEGLLSTVHVAGYEWDELSGSSHFGPAPTTIEVHRPESAIEGTRAAGCYQAAELVSGTVCGLHRSMPESTCERDLSTCDTSVSSAHSWIVEPLLRVLPHDQWHSYEDVDAATLCQQCAPDKPKRKWRLGGKDSTIIPYEDPKSAADYEKFVKSGPEATVAEVQHDVLSRALTVRLGVNLRYLAHRTRARLPADLEGLTKFKWMLNRNAHSAGKGSFSPFRLAETKGIAPYGADLKMSIDLFPQQRLQLAWMMQQEAGEGQEFSLEESEEALLPMSRRVEMRASTSMHVRGGICADHPGFGKTVLTLALTQAESLQKNRPELLRELKARQGSAASGLLPTTATLVFCTGTLLKQWVSEVNDKLGYEKEVLAINTNADLTRRTVEDFERARIVVVNRSVLDKDSYAERLGTFAGVPGPAAAGGRAFEEWLKFATKQIGPHLQVLKSAGHDELKRQVRKQYARNIDNEEFKADIPSRRLRGKDFMAAKDQQKSISKSKANSETARAASKSIDPSCAPLFEMFYWNRIVVDEFHTYTSKESASINSLKADKKWGLSGTPAMDDVCDIAKLAALIGLPLRFKSSRTYLKQRNIRKLQEEMTAFERFDEMRQLPSEALHAQTHEQCQGFLDRFARRNVSDAAGIEYHDHLVPVTLDLNHLAVYTELSQHLNSSEMRIKKGSRSKTTDRDLRLYDAVASSQTAEEALSKTASFCRSNEPGQGVSPSGIEVLIETRQREVQQCLEELPDAFTSAYSAEYQAFATWSEGHTTNEVLGDKETHSLVARILKATTSGSMVPVKAARKKALPEAYDVDGVDTEVESNRALTSLANNIVRRLLVSNRSLRFVRNVKAVSDPWTASKCNRCEAVFSRDTDIAVSAWCGHIICKPCYRNMKDQSIAQCPAEGCSAGMQGHHLLWTDKMTGSRQSSPYGAKFEAVIRLLLRIEQKGDQAILFVQYKDQLDKIAEVLKEHNITATVIKNLSTAGGDIEDFRDTANGPDKKTVIVLNATDETAAGSNLQNANHVIFLSPLLRDSQYAYEATMAQAVGRVRRHGQQKEIQVYRIIALDTIDVDILEHRERRKSALVEQDAIMVDAPKRVREMDMLNEPAPERTQLVREDGRFSLRPQSWLMCYGDGSSADDAEAMAKLKGKSRVLGWEDFSSLVKFSKDYLDD